MMSTQTLELRFIYTVSDEYHTPAAVACLVGSVDKASASRVAHRRFDSRLRRVFFFFPGSSHTSDFKIGTPAATLPGAWRFKVSARTGCDWVR